MRFRTGCALVLAASTLSAAQAPRAAQAPAVSGLPGFGEVVDVDVVNVEVWVTDREGRRVTDLAQGDFTVLEDGKPVEVTNFAAFASGRPAFPQRAAAVVPAPASAAPGAAPSTPAAPAESASVDPENALFLTIFVDDLHLHPDSRTRALEQVRQFLAKGTRPGDRVLVVSHGQSLLVTQPFTTDTGAVDAALRGAERRPTFAQQADEDRRAAFRTMVALNEIEPCAAPMIKPVDAYAQSTQDQALRTLGALKVMVGSLSGVPGRRAVLYVSDGFSENPGEELYEAARQVCRGSVEATGKGPNNDDRETGSGARRVGGTGMRPGVGASEYADMKGGKYSVAQKVEDLAAHASAHRVTLYTLQASGLRGFARADAGFDVTDRGLQMASVQELQTENLKGSLTALAADTGGRAMLDVNDFLPELARMEEDFETYYSLGYTPTGHAGDGRVHKVEVRVKRPGLRVRYRQSYRDKPAAERAVDRTLAALFHGLEDNPLQVEVTVGEQIADAAAKTWSVPVQLKIPLFKLTILNQEQAYRGRLRLLVVTGDDRGGISPVRTVEVPLDIPRKEVLDALGRHYVYTLTLKMPAGRQRVAVAVRDELGGVSSYLSREVRVGGAAPASDR